MSTKDWKRAESLIKSQHQAAAAAIANSAELSSFPLSSIPMDSSGQPQIQTPMAASSPQHIYTQQANYEDEERYHYTTTGKSQHSLYPTLPYMYTQPQRYSQDNNAQVKKASADF